MLAVTYGDVVPGSYAATLMIQLVLSGAAILPVSIVLYLAIERPCMRRDWPQQLARRVRSGWNRWSLTQDAPI